MEWVTGTHSRVLHETTVEPCPSTPIDSILLVLNRLGDDLGVEVVVHVVG